MLQFGQSLNLVLQVEIQNSKKDIQVIINLGIALLMGNCSNHQCFNFFFFVNSSNSNNELRKTGDSQGA